MLAKFYYIPLLDGHKLPQMCMHPSFQTKWQIVKKIESVNIKAYPFVGATILGIHPIYARL